MFVLKCTIVWYIHSRVCVASKFLAKQKHLGYKKMRGQEEPVTKSSDIN